MKLDITPRVNFFRFVLIAIMLFSTLAVLPVSPAHAAGTCYVKETASGANNGISWTAAYSGSEGLQSALGNANCTEIWVAAGTYFPGGTRESAFELKSGVAIYGGFAGTETARSQRDPSTNETILSGDVTQTPSDDTDNAYHVVIANATDSTAVLDGFTITGGYADGGSTNNSGGGIYIQYFNPTLSNLNVEYNTAYISGGGIYTNLANPSMANITFYSNTVMRGEGGGLKVHIGKPVLTNVTFESNTADNGGGIHSYSDMTITNAVFKSNEATIDPTVAGFSGRAGGWYIFLGDPVLTNATFYGNSAEAEGGGMYIEANTTAPTLTNVTFYSNHADTKGGALYSWQAAGTLAHVTFRDNSALVDGGAIHHFSNIEGAQPTIRNSILWDNSTEIFNEGAYHAIVENSVVAGGYPGGTGIITTNPKLGLLGDNGGFTDTIPLLTGSSAIDSANDTYCPTTDQRGVPRPQRAQCDIGAYEVEDSTLISKSAGKYDGWVLESGEFSGKGGTKNNLGKVLQVGDNKQDKQFRAILSFGTAGIPDDAVINKVILKVKKAGVTGTNPMKTHNGLVVDIKKNKFYTLPSLQINDFQAKPNMLKAGKFSKRLYSGWYKAALNTGAHGYINKAGRTQFRLRFLLDDNNNNIADILKLYSGNAIKINRPQLIIKYYVP